MSNNLLRNLPAVHVFLAHAPLQALQVVVGPEVLTAAIRAELADLRMSLLADPTVEHDLAVPTIAARIADRVHRQAALQLRAVINATGIVLHTNLGRAPMADVAAQAAHDAAKGYLNLELDLATGQRSSRQNPIRSVFRDLLGCEDATAVNNCAAATVLTLRALAMGKEVIVARGQLVEIGGSFRIPDIMAVSGAILREVGTTNINRIRDYEAAITPQTGLLLRVHQSNYRIRGFTESATLEELVALGKKHNLPVIDDVGSGALLDFARFGLPGDPIVAESLATGADLVLFSGDKLLGGPQAGVIVGKKNLVQRLERDPLMRAFRLDKMTLAALEATVKLYQHEAKALHDVPLLRMLNTPLAELRTRAETLAVEWRAGGLNATVHDESAYVGGGSLPDLPLPTVVVALEVADAQAVAERLRLGTPAVLSRLHEGLIYFDLRTIFPSQTDALCHAVQQAVGC